MGYGPACGQGPCARRAHSSNPRCARRAHRYGDYVDLSLVVVPSRCALDDGRQHVEREECEGTAGSTVTSGRTMASRGRHDHALPSHTPYYRSRGTAARPLGERARRALETPWYPGGALPGANPPVRSRGLVCKVTRARELRPARSRAWRRHQRPCSGPAPALHAPRRPPGPRPRPRSRASSSAPRPHHPAAGCTGCAATGRRGRHCGGRVAGARNDFGTWPTCGSPLTGRLHLIRRERGTRY